MARQATEVERLRFATGAPWTARPGDWIISLGGELNDVVPPEEFVTRYEAIEDGLILPRPLCSKIEAISGIGSTKTGADLLHALDRLAKISIGDVKIEFTPGQLEEIKHRATKRGQTVEQSIQAIVERIKDELFFRS